MEPELHAHLRCVCLFFGGRGRPARCAVDLEVLKSGNTASVFPVAYDWADPWVYPKTPERCCGHRVERDCIRFTADEIAALLYCCVCFFAGRLKDNHHTSIANLSTSAIRGGGGGHRKRP